MAPSRAPFRPLCTLKTALRQCRAQKVQRRWQHGYHRDTNGYAPDDQGDFLDVTATSTEAPPLEAENSENRRSHLSHLIPSLHPLSLVLREARIMANDSCFPQRLRGNRRKIYPSSRLSRRRGRNARTPWAWLRSHRFNYSIRRACGRGFLQRRIRRRPRWEISCSCG